MGWTNGDPTGLGNLARGDPEKKTKIDKSNQRLLVVEKYIFGRNLMFTVSDFTLLQENGSIILSSPVYLQLSGAVFWPIGCGQQ